MNIEQYRALKAQQEKEGNPEVEVPEEQPTVDNTTIEPEVIEPITPQTIEIDGEEIAIDELRNGYLRQSDYTKKTQKLANEKKEIDEALRFYNDVRNNPDAIESLKQNVVVPRKADPAQAHVIRLEEELYDMKLNNEINLMQSKYEDFEVKDVLTFASEKKMTNIEDAYLLLKSRKGVSSSKAPEVSMEDMKESLKQEIMAEMKGKNTGSIISSKQSGNVATTSDIKITKRESEIASMMGMTSKDYARWRDANK